jgi:hypothetical protein
MKKVSKNNLSIGMQFEIVNETDCTKYEFDEDGYLITTTSSYNTTLDVGDCVTITEVCKKYNCGHGYTGDMVRFKVNGHERFGEFLLFWIDFKKSSILFGKQ